MQNLEIPDRYFFLILKARRMGKSSGGRCGRKRGKGGTGAYASRKPDLKLQ